LVVTGIALGPISVGSEGSSLERAGRTTGKRVDGRWGRPEHGQW